MGNNNIISKIRAHFNIMPDKEDEQEIISQITSGISFRGANLWVLIFAIFTASLGLNVNSTAVIIGAMLISPLMGPIIGMGLAMGINDLDLLRRAAKNFGVATLISVLTAMVYFLITPLGEAQSELLARTSPTIYDVLIATFGGAAGILALCTKGKGNVIPGVAIATALMPPLCTAGFGLATYVGVRLMHFERKEFKTPGLAKKAQRMVMGIAIVTMIPAALMTVGIVRRSIFDNNVNRFLKVELSQNGTQIISSEVDKNKSVLNIVAVGREIKDSTKKEAERRMEQYGLAQYSLNIIQGEQSDSVLRLNYRLSQINNSREDEKKKIMEMSAQITDLNSRLSDYTRLETMSSDVSREMKALFPQVKTISLSRVVEANRDTSATRRFVAAIISLDGRKRMTPEDTKRLHDWLQTRVKADSLAVYSSSTR